jgi:DNA-binding NarL/FixJ family response regulator
MRVLHPGSRVEARQNFRMSSTSIIERQAPGSSVTSRPDNVNTQILRHPLAQSKSEQGSAPIEGARRAASGSIRRRADRQATQLSQEMPNSNETRAAAHQRNRADSNIQNGPSHPQHLNGVNGKDSLKLKKPGIVVIHRRAVFRDCFVRCLEVSYRDHDVFSFANVADWFSSKEPNALAAAIIIIVIDDGDESGVADLEFLEAAAATIPVVIVSDVDDFDHIVRALKSGARGYIPTSLPFNVAVEAVRLVKAGGTFVPAGSFVHDHHEKQPASKTSALLTERQMKVVEEIRLGKANKQIAYELNMSEHTVKVHLRHIMRKLKARNRTEVAVLSGDFFERPKGCQRMGSDVRPDGSNGVHPK